MLTPIEHPAGVPSPFSAAWASSVRTRRAITSLESWVSDRERALLALRVIEVSAKAGLRHAAQWAGPDGIVEVQSRTMELLDELEQKVIHDAPDSTVLAAIEYVRESLLDYRERLH